MQSKRHYNINISIYLYMKYLHKTGFRGKISSPLPIIAWFCNVVYISGLSVLDMSARPVPGSELNSIRKSWSVVVW